MGIKEFDSRQLCGRSKDECERYGKPHIGARYTAKDNTHRYVKDEGALCVICGRPATDTHHWPQLSKGAGGMWTLRTPKGMFMLKPSLFALCRNCHERFHAHSLTAEWAWDSEEYEESWWNGELLARIRPHSKELYEYGCWRFPAFEYREIGGEILRTPITEGKGK